MGVTLCDYKADRLASGNVADQLAAREQIAILRRFGFGDLLDLIQSQGPLDENQIACLLGIARRRARTLLEEARDFISLTEKHDGLAEFRRRRHNRLARERNSGHRAGILR